MSRMGHFVTSDGRLFSMSLDDDSDDPSSFQVRPVPEIHGGVLSLDVYHPKGEIDWGLVYEQGYYLAIIKASQGKGFHDHRFQENVLRARDAGLLALFYHYLDADSLGNDPSYRRIQEHATRCAAGLLQDVQKVGIPRPVYFRDGSVAHGFIDCEQTLGGLDEYQGEFWLDTFLHNLGPDIAMGFYSKHSWLEREVTPTGWERFALKFRTSLWGNRSFWVARYGKNDGLVPDIQRYNPAEKLPPGWDWAVWQYTSNGRVPGVRGRVDLNIARIDWVRTEGK